MQLKKFNFVFIFPSHDLIIKGGTETYTSFIYKVMLAEAQLSSPYHHINVTAATIMTTITKVGSMRILNEAQDNRQMRQGGDITRFA
jgi:hypothetical protein